LPSSSSSSSSCQPDTCNDAYETAVFKGCAAGRSGESGVNLVEGTNDVAINSQGKIFGPGVLPGNCGGCNHESVGLPSLCSEECETILKAKFPGGPTYTFEEQGDGSYEQIYGIGATLTHTGDVFILTLSDEGTVWKFKDFQQSNEGSFDTVIMPGGQSLAATYSGADITKVEAWRKEFPGRSRPGGDVKPELDPALSTAPNRPAKSESTCSTVGVTNHKSWDFIIYEVKKGKVTKWQDDFPGGGKIYSENALTVCRNAKVTCPKGYTWSCSGWIHYQYVGATKRTDLQLRWIVSGSVGACVKCAGTCPKDQDCGLVLGFQRLRYDFPLPEGGFWFEDCGCSYGKGIRAARRARRWR